MKNKTAIVAKLIEHGKQYYQPDAARVPKEVLSDPFAFLVGVAFNRGMPYQKAWEIPLCIKNKNMLNAKKLAAMEKLELQRLLESLSIRPRYGCRLGAKTLEDAARLVMAHGGDASAIWRNSSPRETIRKLRSIYGVGSGIASMAVRILHDNSEDIFSGHEYQIDLKPDVQVMRVFKRTGLTGIESEAIAVNTARELHPAFPGALDWPAWNIGRNWCFSDGPNCTQCPLDAVCEKAI